MQHSQISTVQRSIAYLQKKYICIVAEQMTLTEIGEIIADFVLNTALYTRACWALKDCTFFYCYLWEISLPYFGPKQ